MAAAEGRTFLPAGQGPLEKAVQIHTGDSRAGRVAAVVLIAPRMEGLDRLLVCLTNFGRGTHVLGGDAVFLSGCSRSTRARASGQSRSACPQKNVCIDQTVLLFPPTCRMCLTRTHLSTDTYAVLGRRIIAIGGRRWCRSSAPLAELGRWFEARRNALTTCDHPSVDKSNVFFLRTVPIIPPAPIVILCCSHGYVYKSVAAAILRDYGLVSGIGA